MIESPKELAKNFPALFASFTETKQIGSISVSGGLRVSFRLVFIVVGWMRVPGWTCAWWTQLVARIV